MINYTNNDSTFDMYVCTCIYLYIAIYYLHEYVIYRIAGKFGEHSVYELDLRMCVHWLCAENLPNCHIKNLAMFYIPYCWQSYTLLVGKGSSNLSTQVSHH